MERLRSGDRQAMGECYLKYEPTLRRFIDRRMGSSVRRWSSAEMLATDVFLETVAKLGSLKTCPTEAVFLARLLRVARSRIYDLARRHRREVGESGVSAGAFEEHSAWVQRDPLEERDTRRWLETLTARLSSAHQNAITLCDYVGLSYKDASAILKIRADTLRKRHKKARAQLRQLAKRKRAS